MKLALEAEEEDWKRNLIIEFVGEEGVDTGLRRQFLLCFVQVITRV